MALLSQLQEALNKYVEIVCSSYHAFFHNKAKDTGGERWHVAGLAWNLPFWIFLGFFSFH